MSKKKINFSVFIGIFILGFYVNWAPDAAALISPDPMDYYHAGFNHLNAYQGDEHTLNRASQYFIELVDRYPDFPLGYLGLSQISIIQAYRFDKHHQMEQIRNEALPLALRALELGPLMPEVHLHYDLIKDLFEKHRHNQEIAQKYLELLPEEAETFFLLGQYLLAQDDYEKSREFFETALDLNPEASLQAKILKRLGHIALEYLAQPQQAVEYYRQAIQLSPADGAGLEGLAEAYLENGQYDLAFKQLKKAHQIASRSTIEYSMMIAKGYLAEKKGQTDRAIIYFEKALQISNNQASQICYHLGNLYFRIQNYAQAFQKFKKVIELKPYDYVDIYYLAGRSAYSMGDDHSAEDYFKKHLQINNSGSESDWIRTHIPNLSHK